MTFNRYEISYLKEQVYQANMALPKYKLITFTWGNVSGITEDRQFMVIKPSGVDYDKLTADSMVVVDLSGNVVEGKLRPSSDTLTHIELYRQYPEIKGIVHTHSPYAVVWAQAKKAIPALGTTHADYFYGDIPCSRALTEQEIKEAYEKNTGKVIIETIQQQDPLAIPGIVVSEHGPFAWGNSPDNAVHNAVVLEEVAKMALFSKLLNPELTRIDQHILDKHYFRKHGSDAYYGQK
ncbi:ribulose 5-phosphate epimerase [Gallibacterium salpingitidis]|uniref:L-ribulose-5-phosphate 4-epimerase n=1 Tax=Gallibacterium salpingitidis TaxID=505341 RepID=A0AB36E3E3_9PAST|nr:L-ribulose-5-phosphate 4-epimerase [Gallibacterium salpingitidis]OBX07454.1 ribulose 5-phosphate epimerase [Gallibacterium salpingitidis]OBX10837.1 ribulose 5-phosphate epimerase [Gallibacterium salpingitidis]